MVQGVDCLKIGFLFGLWSGFSYLVWVGVAVDVLIAGVLLIDPLDESKKLIA